MPADGNHGSIGALTRLARELSAWRQRRARRRRTHWRSFMDLSDRTLADIGLHRADVHAAMVGAMPLRRRSTDHDQPLEAAICRLPKRPSLPVVSNDLGAAA
jgi:uncharacterized protein YjiS (DUF1127 family)